MKRSLFQLDETRLSTTMTTTTTELRLGLSVGDLTFGECRPGVSPKCIVRCRDNDIDLSYRRVEASRIKSRRDVRLSRGVKNKRDSLSWCRREVMTGKGRKRERARGGGEIASRAPRKRSIDRVIADAR